MTSGPATIAARLERLRARLETLGVDALLVTTPSNRRWISGFTGSAGMALVSRDEARFATDSRYWEQVGQQCHGYTLVQVSGANTGVAPQVLEGMGGLKVGFEPADLSYAGYEAWTGALAEMPAHSRPAFVPAPRAIEDLRMVKDAEEIDAITRAVLLGDDAFRHAASRLEPGMTEKQVAWIIQEYAHQRGAEGLSFASIVAGGAHGSLPHWRASDTPLQVETGVVIDMGVVVDGYCSDLTRTVWLGERPSAEFTRIYDIVLTAQETAEQRIEAGMLGKVGHEIAHEVIRQAGHGEHFGHGLGHGVGLDIHEDPRLAPSGEIPLADGHVVTVEPGIYIPGWGGIRIEDQCVMEDGRLRVISTAPKIDL
ncbi:MAG: Xaa-Pro peptidase family protein [Dehalococcoidia bacterium]|nr:Xaa-Pro peptidase family protein [Dehalococcoidia bacterium]